MMWALHRAALANGIVPLVPAVTVAEGYRTEARNDRIAELLDGTEVEPFIGEAARRSGELAARCDTSDLSRWPWSSWPSGATVPSSPSARPCCARRRRSSGTSSCSTRPRLTWAGGATDAAPALSARWHRGPGLPPKRRSRRSAPRANARRR